MISLESEVLQRHLPRFYGKKILFSGALYDQFPQQLSEHCRSVSVWSWYFDYAKNQSAVNFSIKFEPEVDLVVYYWTKNKEEVNFQLMQLLANSKPAQEFLIVGENRCGIRSVEKLLQPYGDIYKIDSARRCGLYHFSLKKPPHFDLESYWRHYQHPSLNNLTIYSLPGVFSAKQLDGGTALLLSTLNEPITGKVLDLGCGAGVIGAMIKKYSPTASVTLSDIHAMAIASARRTFEENQLDGEVIASDVFSHIQGKFNLIISNPPFHDGIDTAYRATTELIQKAKCHLTVGGELRLVANAFLPYPHLLQQYFGGFEVIAQNNKFKVYSAKN